MTVNALHLLIPRRLSEHSNTHVPFVIIGDKGFRLNDNLLRPYRRTHMDKYERIFNYRLTRAKKHVERSFGILSNKWRIFHRHLDVNKEIGN